ncbi:aldo/keto reductase [Kineococcus sp. SYSU DK005]|uniref:aldo/keto reductase n=1 Tax=Kineococcus sp. SYSU DK005 TaxID=3383126 RepID=UPI003D7EC2F8
MQHRTLGRSGLSVSAFALGTMTFGAGTDRAEAFAQLDAFTAAGGTLVDTADVYAGGESERLVGQWLAARPADVTEHVVLATKGRFPTDEGPNGAGLSRRHLTRALEGSLRRLGVDSVDLYQAHSWDPLTPLEETLSFLDDAVRAGKVRYAGVSNFTGWQVQKTADVAAARGGQPIASLQLQYNLLAREVEWELVPAAASAGAGLLAWSPLAGGVLSGKYAPGRRPAPGTRLADPLQAQLFGSRTGAERTWAVLAELERVARDHGATPAQVALAWLAARPGVASVVLGARTLAQLESNLDAAGTSVSAEGTARLDAVSAPAVDYPYGGFAPAGRLRDPAGAPTTPPTTPPVAEPAPRLTAEPVPAGA